jgi:hypothetical protein
VSYGEKLMSPPPIDVNAALTVPIISSMCLGSPFIYAMKISALFQRYAPFCYLCANIWFPYQAWVWSIVCIYAPCAVSSQQLVCMQLAQILRSVVPPRWTLQTRHMTGMALCYF